MWPGPLAVGAGGWRHHPRSGSPEPGPECCGLHLARPCSLSHLCPAVGLGSGVSTPAWRGLQAYRLYPPIPSVASRGLGTDWRSVQGTESLKQPCSPSFRDSANGPSPLKLGCRNSDWALWAACPKDHLASDRAPGGGRTHLDAVRHTGAVHAAGHVHRVAPDVVLRLACPDHPGHDGSDIEPCRGQKSERSSGLRPTRACVSFLPPHSAASPADSRPEDTLSSSPEAVLNPAAPVSLFLSKADNSGPQEPAHTPTAPASSQPSLCSAPARPLPQLPSARFPVTSDATQLPSPSQWHVSPSIETQHTRTSPFLHPHSYLSLGVPPFLLFEPGS